MADQLEIREPQVIVKEFNQKIRDLIVRLTKKSRREDELANIDRLNQRISTLKSTMGDAELICRTRPIAIKYADRIINRVEYEKLITETDARKEYLKNNPKISPDDEFIFTIIDSIKSYYSRAVQTEKDELYSVVKCMFDACIEYAIACGGD